jgi:hypothetical protein
MRNIDYEVIKNKKITLATPVRNGTVNLNYLVSIINLMVFATENQLQLSVLYLDNESLITRSRNNLVSQFLDSSSDYLFFVDSDISFNKEDFFYLVYLAETQKNMKVITAPYPQKKIHWNNLEIANSLNLINSAKDYESYSGRFGLGFKEDDVDIDKDIPIEIIDGSTGFMLIAREVFESFKKEYPEQEYQDHQVNKEKFAFFDCKIDEKDKSYLSEDYMFTRYVSKIGYSVWLIPWIKLEHLGSHMYSGDFINFLKLKTIKYGNLN